MQPSSATSAAAAAAAATAAWQEARRLAQAQVFNLAQHEATNGLPAASYTPAAYTNTSPTKADYCAARGIGCKRLPTTSAALAFPYHLSVPYAGAVLAMVVTLPMGQLEPAAAAGLWEEEEEEDDNNEVGFLRRSTPPKKKPGAWRC